MKLGILRTGHPPKPAMAQFGDYPAMFRRLLGETAFDYRTYAVDEGELPDRPEDCEAYLITGSSAGVYDPLPWIAPAKAFLNAARGRARLVGVCFGHQLMAEAFGGKVLKTPKGWGVGQHDYRILMREPWMREPWMHEPWMDDAGSVRLPASHQDQVVEVPPSAEVFAASDFAPIGGLVYRDQPAFSIQLHPEFEPAFAVALITNAREGRYAPDQAQAAVASYASPDDRARVGRWIKAFLAA